MRIVTDRDEVRELLTRHPGRHLLAIGDLDDAFWPHTRFVHGWGQTLLLYTGLQTPVVLAVADPPASSLHTLVASYQAELPDRFYGHLSEEAAEALRPHFTLDVHGILAYMSMKPVTGVAREDVVEIGPADLPEIQALQQAANPDGGFFEPEMLRAGPYLGIRRGGELIAMGGTHTWSATEKVAVLGNIATHPAHRRQGLAAAVTAALCARFGGAIDVVGLTVDVANTPAIRCYAGLGFTEDVRVVGARCARL
ncbi:MAG: GNAT family N-acetyltransferase [Hamadaea sp.]|uniref:GNAT family N-acetyltransferase n=1 Tax=Hamadaea sp. TaxID=2024425 RepID=UPI0017D718E3|nr:GNAT family N-acetyltransferase [Hamadaea sp.]NUT22473.1 GNAT family N-acetyltransferase [Hamadaea sp.]